MLYFHVQNLSMLQTKLRHNIMFCLKSLKEKMWEAIDKKCDFHKNALAFFVFCCSFRCTYISAIYSIHTLLMTSLVDFWLSWRRSDEHFCRMGYERPILTWNPSIRTTKAQTGRIWFCNNTYSISFTLGCHSKSTGLISLPFMKSHSFSIYHYKSFRHSRIQVGLIAKECVLVQL